MQHAGQNFPSLGQGRALRVLPEALKDARKGRASGDAQGLLPGRGGTCLSFTQRVQIGQRCPNPRTQLAESLAVLTSTLLDLSSQAPQDELQGAPLHSGCAGLLSPSPSG